MKPKIDEKLEKLTTNVQQKLNEYPALLVGSGGSVPYGLPSMKDLATEITSKLDAKYSGEDTWKSFMVELKSTNNLESALEKNLLNEEIQDAIIWTVWALMDKKDRDAINHFLKTGTTPALTLIIKKFVQRAGATNIVTTNYDRLIECAIDFCQGKTETCFSGNCIKRFDNFQTNSSRTVNLFKVHGSVDWFKHKTNHSMLATPFFNANHLADTFRPMIVAPGNEKYKETHHDPFRTVMGEADKALRAAGSYLCIGYGFNDEHIQPIIIGENCNQNKPIVIVTKDITPKMRELFLGKDARNCLIISEDTSGGTLVHYSTTEKERFAASFWCVDSFYKLWFE